MRPGRRGLIQRLSEILRPHEPISRAAYLAGVAASAAGLLAVWAVLTYGGFVAPLFLPSPSAIIGAAADLLADGSLLVHTQASVTVIVTGWALAVALAVPLGILMGTLKFVEALLEPVVDFVRYLPVSAMIPLLILYIGIGTAEKVAVIFIGTFFQLILLIADVSANVSKDLLDSAYTLGARRGDVVRRVLLPATLPGVMDNLRITMGWAWTYLIVAELVAADRGLGYMILDAGRGLFTDRIFVGLFTIGLLGFAFDFTFKWLHRLLLPWSPRV
ncbi:MAG: ABC transporter permease [Armatimonadota bacterium]|nr:ABC transporter permease [Armatimonadota bacterium]MDR7550358.1 ABC transporter permease [Armatimonadota bacterium]